jgi:hypothetical protein
MSGGVLIPPGPVRVLVATKPVDFRKGIDGLAALVKEQLQADPFSGVIFCFRAKRADRVKLVFCGLGGPDRSEFRRRRGKPPMCRRGNGGSTALALRLETLRLAVPAPEAVQ